MGLNIFSTNFLVLGPPIFPPVIEFSSRFLENSENSDLGFPSLEEKFRSLHTYMVIHEAFSDSGV